MPMKLIPLQLDEFVTGIPAEGYELYDLIAAQDSLEVAAKQEVLDAMTTFSTELPLDVEGATGDVSGYVHLRRPTGIENTVPYDVAVTAKIREKEIQRTLRQIPVEVDGLDDTMTAAISRSSQTVQLGGIYSFINGLREEDVRLFVDVSGLAAGEYTLPVQISIDNAPAFSCALSSPQVKVTIAEK